MQDQRLWNKIARGLSRDAHLPFPERVQKGVRLMSETANARLFLRRCTTIGEGARLIGRARIENLGQIHVGRGLALNSGFLPTELLTGPEGRIEIGDDVWINFGCVIAAKQRVKIGARAQLGPHCIVSDLEVPDEVLRGGNREAKPVEIGDDVWLAGRVTLLPGVKIGAGSVVTAGSVVDADIPPRVVAGGIPARVLRSLDAPPAAEAPNGNGALARAEPAPPAPPMAPLFSGTVVADFTVDELGDELADAAGGLPLAAEIAPFGQVTQVLLLPPSPGHADFLVAWTRPEAVLPAFARIASFEEVTDEELQRDVDAFCELVERAARNYRFVFVPTWAQGPWSRGLGLLDARKGGITRALSVANLRLMDNLSRTSNAFALDADRWYKLVGRPAASHRAWYLGKIDVAKSVMAEAAADIRSALLGLTGSARKLLVLDLDDTLWGGIVGDVGWESLRLGGHDSVGEALVDFQRAIKRLKRRGVILAIVSKNEESVALEAIRQHPEMVLRQDDFVGWRINWTDKARNILELARELNLGLQSVVFIDDNPVERARVREALPEVLVPEWPEDKLLYPSAFQRLGCFDTPALSKEDLERTRLYAEERKRDELQRQVGSIDEWLKSLELKVRAEPLGAANLARATQLLNKTNQLNLSTRRLSEAELTEWTRDPNRRFWAVSVSDRFGDAGLTGLVSLQIEGQTARIVDYVLSCRVMGRKVEETLVHLAVTAAREAGVLRVQADYLATPKNKPCLTFWKASGFANQDDQLFSWDCREPYLLPEPIGLEWNR